MAMRTDGGLMADGPNPLPPPVRLALAVTGHRAGHPAFDNHQDVIEAAMASLFAVLADAVAATFASLNGDGGMAKPVRLHSLVAEGVDQLAANLALARGWDLVLPLPFGRALYQTVNAHPQTVEDARALIAGTPAGDAKANARAEAIRTFTERAHVFALAEQDAQIAALLLDHLATPDDLQCQRQFAAEMSMRVSQANLVMIEQSDILIAVWDGVTTAPVGGTGHTIAAALDMGTPVIWIDPARPDTWRMVRSPEALASCASWPDPASAHADVAHLVRASLDAGADDRRRLAELKRERWRPASTRFAHAYRRVETLFGGPSPRSRFRNLTDHYASPDAPIAADAWVGSEQIVAQLADNDQHFLTRIADGVMRRFRWADGVSSRLSDAYRGGMIINFLLSSLAIVGGIAYLPLVGPAGKWAFALFELMLLVAILVITWIGQRKCWHSRWFETRRLAEYLRHAPLLLLLGAARAPGRWPGGTDTSWPEFYVRHTLRDIGLPRIAVTVPYLRSVLVERLGAHVASQRRYHQDKAQRLATVHHNLDRFSTLLFQLAVVTVALYLGLRGAAALAIIDEVAVDHAAKVFTLLGVLFPTFGAGIAGIRYFGDFQRFSAISEATAQKLASVEARITTLAAAPDAAITYRAVADLAHAADSIVFAEIESWQSVFGGKHMAVPV